MKQMLATDPDDRPVTLKADGQALKSITKTDARPPNKEMIMIKLQLKFKATILKELLTDKTEIAIGRDSGNDLCIDNLAASSRHARLFKGPDDKYAVEDLNSTNGTLVNGKEVMTQVLVDNDLIAIGKHTIHVTYQDNDAFKKQKSSHVGESTYILSKKDLEKMKR